MKLTPYDQRTFLGMAIFQVSFWTVFLIIINEKLIETKQNLYSNKEQRMSVMLGT